MTDGRAGGGWAGAAGDLLVLVLSSKCPGSRRGPPTFIERSSHHPLRSPVGGLAAMASRCPSHPSLQTVPTTPSTNRSNESYSETLAAFCACWFCRTERINLYQQCHSDFNHGNQEERNAARTVSSLWSRNQRVYEIFLPSSTTLECTDSTHNDLFTVWGLFNLNAVTDLRYEEICSTNLAMLSDHF